MRAARGAGIAVTDQPPSAALVEPPRSVRLGRLLYAALLGILLGLHVGAYVTMAQGTTVIGGIVTMTAAVGGMLFVWLRCRNLPVE